MLLNLVVLLSYFEVALPFRPFVNSEVALIQSLLIYYCSLLHICTLGSNWSSSKENYRFCYMFIVGEIHSYMGGGMICKLLIGYDTTTYIFVCCCDHNL